MNSDCKEVAENDYTRNKDEKSDKKSSDEKKQNKRNRRSRRQSKQDFDWYNRLPMLTDSVTKVSWTDVAGRPTSWSNPVVTNNFVSSGFVVLGLTPSFGWADAANSAINQAALKLQLFLQRTVSTKLDFDAPDLMIYSMGMSQVYSMLNFIQRAYGTIDMFDAENRYMPQALMQAQGLSYKDWSKNKADVRFRIGTIINKIESMPMPKVFTALNREAFIYQNYYKEGTSVKDQMYMFAPDYFYQFYLDEGSSALELVKWDRTVEHTVDQTFDFLEALISPLLDAGDMSRIGGTVLRAFNNSQLITFSNIPVDYRMAVTFDIVVLEQMKNATIVNPRLWSPDAMVWAQDSTKTFLIHNGQVTSTDPAAAALVADLKTSRILTTSTEYTDKKLVMESTRLMTVATGNTNTQAPIYTGNEFVSTCTAYKFMYSGTTVTLEAIDLQYNSNASTATGINAAATKRVLEHSHFKFAPLNYLLTYVANSSGTAITSMTKEVIGDIDNYAMISADELINIHDAAISNLWYFDLPSTTAWQGK